MLDYKLLVTLAIDDNALCSDEVFFTISAKFLTVLATVVRSPGYRQRPKAVAFFSLEVKLLKCSGSTILFCDMLSVCNL